MHMEVLPKVPPDQLEREVYEATLKELAWLITEIQESLLTLRSGLEECLALLAPTQPGSTLVLSTTRSEGLKGIVNRVGSEIVKADIQMKMHGLQNTKGLSYYRLQLASPPSPNPAPDAPSKETPKENGTKDFTVTTSRPSTASTPATLRLPQLIDCRNFVHQALETLPTPATVEHHTSTPFTDLTATSIIDAKLLSQSLSIILSAIRSARQSLKQTHKSNLFPYHAVDATLFDPTLPENLTLDVTIQDAAIVTEVRIVEGQGISSGVTGFGALVGVNIDHHLPSFGFREKIAGAFKGRGVSGVTTSVIAGEKGKLGAGAGGEDAAGKVVYKGVEVKVKERIRVESQDPSLMSVVSKLGALEHNVAMWATSLGIVMRSGGVEGCEDL